MTRVPASRYVVFALLAGGGLFWDLLTKDAVFADLGYPGGRPNVAVPGQHTLFEYPPHREGESLPFLEGWVTGRFFTSFNHGALWGIGQNFTWVFAFLSVLAGCGVIYWLFVHKAAASLWLTIALSLIMAGTLGNLWDRAGMHGYIVNGVQKFAVRDFLLFTFGTYHWPVFNFADVFLVTGAIMLVVQSFLTPTGSTDAKSGAENENSEQTVQTAG